MPKNIVRSKKSATVADASRRRSQERFWLLAASLVLGLGLLLTYRAKTEHFDEAQAQLDAGALINVNALPSAQVLLPLLAPHYADSTDRHYAADTLASLLRGGVPNVGALNISIPPDTAAKYGGPDLQRRAAATPENRKVALLPPGSFSQIKEQLVARTPGGFNKQFWLLTVVFFGLFWGIHLVWTARSFQGDALLLPVVFLLLGLSLIFMLSLPDPLQDYLRMQRVVFGSIAGCALLLVVSLLDVQKLGRAWSYSTKSYLWLGLAALLSLALILLGTGPEGSSAKVNLWIFQPVELIKACLLLFFAGYFARNWEFLRELKQRKGLHRAFRRMELAVPRLAYTLPIVVGVAVALVFFAVQRDLGPALVICTTFLLLYGLVRRRWLAAGLGFLGLIAGFWILYRFPIFSTVVSRIDMMLSPWENTAWGGEHLAQAFWALASGGFLGQGLGHGSPSSIPAAHTDMIMAVIGEELGFLGFVAVLALYVMLIQRGLIISLRAKAPYSFFLGMGIVLMTALQLLLITGGMLGLIPLSGVVSPFLSYGMTATVMNLLFLGALFSISAHPGTRDQQAAQHKRFGRPVMALSLVLVALLGGMALRAAYIQIWRGDEWLLKPTLVNQAGNSHGYRYNQRVLNARTLVPRGTIYDRNGLPLATNHPEEITDHQEALQEAGVDVGALLHKSNERLYPFGSLTFYLLGDVNTRAKWGASDGLYVEDSLYSKLRGYDNAPETFVIDNPRTPEVDTLVVTRYNYAALLPFVRHGPDSPGARRLIDEDKDVHLTIDVRLQRRVADVIRDHVGADANLKGRNISAVVLDVATGDVLASVTYPLPDSVHVSANTADFVDRAAYGIKAPGSTFKLATAMAGYRVLGNSADTWTTDTAPGVLMSDAIKRSSNPFFSALAYEAGPDAMLDVINAFGFTLGGQNLSRSQRLSRLRRDLNDRAQTGFGQGEVVGNPLRVARLAATVANDGEMLPVNWFLNLDGPSRPSEQVITPAQARRLAAAMRRVVAEQGGTAFNKLPRHGIAIAGKTGTAEERTKNGRIVNNAWFTGFAPYREVPNGAPQIAVAVLVEAKDDDRGGRKLGGGKTAAPIAGSIIDEAVDLGIIRRADFDNR